MGKESPGGGPGVGKPRGRAGRGKLPSFGEEQEKALKDGFSNLARGAIPEAGKTSIKIGFQFYNAIFYSII